MENNSETYKVYEALYIIRIYNFIRDAEFGYEFSNHILDYICEDLDIGSHENVISLIPKDLFVKKLINLTAKDNRFETKPIAIDFLNYLDCEYIKVENKGS